MIRFTRCDGWNTTSTMVKVELGPLPDRELRKRPIYKLIGGSGPFDYLFSNHTNVHMNYSFCWKFIIIGASINSTIQYSPLAPLPIVVSSGKKIKNAFSGRKPSASQACSLACCSNNWKFFSAGSTATTTKFTGNSSAPGKRCRLALEPEQTTQGTCFGFNSICLLKPWTGSCWRSERFV